MIYIFQRYLKRFEYANANTMKLWAALREVCTPTWFINSLRKHELSFDRINTASGGTQDLKHSFSQYGPPGWRIT